MSWIAVGMGVAQLGYGIYQNVQGANAAKNLERPEYKIPLSLKKALGSAQLRSLQGMPGAVKSEMLQEMDRSRMASLAQVNERRGGLGVISQLEQKQHDSIRQIGLMDIQERNKNLQNLQQMRTQMAQQEQQAFQYNEMQKYQEEAGAASAMQGAGLQNIFGGVSSVASVAASGAFSKKGTTTTGADSIEARGKQAAQYGLDVSEMEYNKADNVWNPIQGTVNPNVEGQTWLGTNEWGVAPVTNNTTLAGQNTTGVDGQNTIVLVNQNTTVPILNQNTKDEYINGVLNPNYRPEVITPSNTQGVSTEVVNTTDEFLEGGGANPNYQAPIKETINKEGQATIVDANNNQVADEFEGSNEKGDLIDTRDVTVLMTAEEISAVNIGNDQINNALANNSQISLAGNEGGLKTQVSEANQIAAAQDYGVDRSNLELVDGKWVPKHGTTNTVGLIYDSSTGMMEEPTPLTNEQRIEKREGRRPEEDVANQRIFDNLTKRKESRGLTPEEQTALDEATEALKTAEVPVNNDKVTIVDGEEVTGLSTGSTSTSLSGQVNTTDEFIDGQLNPNYEVPAPTEKDTKNEFLTDDKGEIILDKNNNPTKNPDYKPEAATTTGDATTGDATTTTTTTTFRDNTEVDSKRVDRFSVQGSAGENKANVLKDGKTIEVDVMGGIATVTGVRAEGNDLIVDVDAPFGQGGAKDMGKFVKSGDGYKFEPNKDIYGKLKGEDKKDFDAFIKAVESDPEFAKQLLASVTGTNDFNPSDYGKKKNNAVNETREDRHIKLNKEYKERAASNASEETYTPKYINEQLMSHNAKINENGSITLYPPGSKGKKEGEIITIEDLLSTQGKERANRILGTKQKKYKFGTDGTKTIYQFGTVEMIYNEDGSQTETITISAKNHPLSGKTYIRKSVDNPEKGSKKVIDEAASLLTEYTTSEGSPINVTYFNSGRKDFDIDHITRYIDGYFKKKDGSAISDEDKKRLIKEMEKLYGRWLSHDIQTVKEQK